MHQLLSTLRFALVPTVMALSASVAHATASPVLDVLPVSSYTMDLPGAGGAYADSGNELIDGVMDVRVYGGYNLWDPYVLWDGASPTITFDLGVSRQVDAVQGHFLTYPNAAVYLPLAATFKFSDDGINYSAPVTYLTGYTDTIPLGNDQPVTLSLLGASGQGRYVAMKLTTPGRWIALGEVQLLSAVPEPESLALALAGLGVVASLGMRRRAAGTVR